MPAPLFRPGVLHPAVTSETIFGGEDTHGGGRAAPEGSNDLICVRIDLPRGRRRRAEKSVAAMPSSSEGTRSVEGGTSPPSAGDDGDWEERSPLLEERQGHLHADADEGSGRVVGFASDGFATPRNDADKDVAEKRESMHTRHLSHEDWSGMNAHYQMSLNRLSLTLEEEMPHHRRRQSVNPLERAADQAFYQSVLESARSGRHSVRSPASLGSPKMLSADFDDDTPKAKETAFLQEIADKLKRQEPAGNLHSLESLAARASFSVRSDDGAHRPPRTIKVSVPKAIPEAEFCNNAVSTAKYNIATFLPLFLFKMFSRVAYVYFLVQAGLCYWSAISPFSPYGATFALVFVLAVAAVKEICEDKKRHVEDRRTNATSARVLQPDGTFETREWRSIFVGDVIHVVDDELIPADLLCIHTALPDEVCFIKTANLDGESNLKIRRPVMLTSHDNAAVGGEGGGEGGGGGGEAHNASPTIHEIEAEGTTPPGAGSREGEGEGEEGMGGGDGEGGDPLSPPLDSPKTYRHSCMGAGWMRGFQSVKAEVCIEQPSANLESVSGFVNLEKSDKYDKPMAVPITMNEMLLRGCMLKNSGYILGVVVYTGRETRIQMNNRRVPFKMGSFDTFLNVQIVILLLVQLCLCVGCALAKLMWRERQGKFRYYLLLTEYSDFENNADPVIFVCIAIIQYWILYSYMIPISLFVSNEIVKFWQTFIFVNRDKRMMDAGCEEPARARNSNVVEDLGKISHVFCDKTGTLTSNDMRLRAIGIGGAAFGGIDQALEYSGLEGKEAVAFFDERLSCALEHLPDPSHRKKKADGGSAYECVTVWNDNKVNSDEDINYERLGIMLHEYFLAICICHSLIIESRQGQEGDVGENRDAEEGEGEGKGEGDGLTYQGPSPDEVALVDAARQLGFEFKQRSSRHITLAFQGTEFSVEILNVLEFSSDRKKMSVIARGPDGVIRVYSKGADSAILSTLNSKYKVLPDGDTLLHATDQLLLNFSCQGLRTMCVASKVLSEEVWEAWDAMYQEAALSLDSREEMIASCAVDIESNMDLLGVTAIEDKLQDGVPETIEIMGKAGIKVFMITGDKQETAISIAISCNLVQEPDKIMILNEKTEKAANKKLREYIQDCDNTKYYTADYLQPCERKELVVDGFTLTHVLGTASERLLAELCSKCSSVVVCRASPAQKSAVLCLMKRHQMLMHSPTYAAGKTPWRLSAFYYKLLWKLWDGRMLAIGDGANDVAMLQSADVGVGIAGKEGRQAVNNSDFSISHFRFLERLLLIHGQLSYYRLAHLIKYSFYKNIAFALCFFYFQFFCGFSSQPIIGSWASMVYNVLFTSVPIVLLATLDKPLQMKKFLMYPQTYNRSRALSTWNFWKGAFAKACFTSGVSFFVPYLTTKETGKANTQVLYVFGPTVLISLLGIVTIEVMILARSWTKIFVIFSVISYVLIFLFYPIIEGLCMAFNVVSTRVNSLRRMYPKTCEQPVCIL